ncbi:MAG: PQQ-binding-like beta-propeller repeat protein [Verrucomicrobia bacterium]|jgi:outer membrane protein assembly factor BamB|nr:PQQ-binding-like beta-propeller repeat protein [Verrucomicrobiota bacterium]
MLRLMTCLSLAILSLSSALGDNWPQWRGPTATGVAPPGAYPAEFSDMENVAWKTKLPSRASSTPAVWGDSIFITGCIGLKDGVLCLDRSGRERWRVTFGKKAKGKHSAASGANSSPLTDGQRVFVYFKSGTIAALDFAGNVIWEDNLQDRFGKNTLWWDLGTSPVLAAGNVIVAVMQAGDSFLVALDAATGEMVWKEPRTFTCPEESDQSYTTPTVLTQNGHERIFVWGADHLTAHDAITGETLWVCDGFNPDNKEQWRSIASASVWNEIAVVCFGRGRNLCAVDLRDTIEPTKRFLWKRQGLGADVPTPVTHDGKAYLLEDGGKLYCIDIRTGKTLWTSTAPRGKGRFYASPILAGSRLYCASDRGIIVSGSADRSFSGATTNKMNEPIISTPIAVDNRLFVRGAKHLFCLGN